jgi:uncharacterized protein YcbX
MDVSARIAQLMVYPVKSCRGIDLPTTRLEGTGLDWDRTWMLVDPQGEFVSQRELPRMALITPTFKGPEVVLRAPGMLALHLHGERVEAPTRVRVWGDELQAWDMGDLAAQWFNDFLQPAAHGQPSLAPLRLVRFDPDVQRLSPMKWTGDVEAPNQFSDGFPILVASLASLADLNERLVAAGHAPVEMARFRPNLVIDGVQAFDEDRLDELLITTAQGEVRLRMVKPCARCPIPNVNPTTGSSSPEVGDMLQTYRQSSVVPGVTFGMNAIVVSGQGCDLAVGQAVSANWRFE